MINPLFADIIAGAGEAYSAAGYGMVLSVVPEAEEAEVYRTMPRQHRVDGVIVHGPRLGDPRVGLLAELGLPCVIHGRAGRCAKRASWLDIDNAGAFARATALLIGLGHRRIALLNGLETLHFAHCRRQGFEAALRAGGTVPDPALMRSNEMNEPYGHASALEMLSRPDPPTAFLAASILTALGVLRAVRELGLVPGREVSIVTHDDDLSFVQNAGAVPLFTATRASIRAAGRRTAEILIDRIEDPSRPVVQELWRADLVEGRTTGRPAPRVAL